MGGGWVLNGWDMGGWGKWSVDFREKNVFHCEFDCPSEVFCRYISPREITGRWLRSVI